MSAQNLSQLQQNFQNYLLHKDTGIMTDIVSDQRNSATVRLDIYQNAYFLRLLESLRNDYPILAKWLGYETFNQLGQKYIAAHPSHYRSIRWYGSNFPRFIQSQPEPQHEFLSELANFELGLATAFDAKNNAVVIDTALQNIPPEKWAKITFHFHPSLQLLDLNWNVAAVWKATNIATGSKVKPKKYRQAKTYLIWRKELETYFTKLTAAEAWALQAAQKKMLFEEICTGLSQWVSTKQLILYAANLLKLWIHRGLITAIEIN